jgi:phosphoglycerate dehydrogenase-like enzyme
MVVDVTEDGFPVHAISPASECRRTTRMAALSIAAGPELDHPANQWGAGKMTAASGGRRLNILIASPLEAEQVQRIRDFAPDRAEVMYAPELLATPRYVADHHGVARDLDEAELQRWRDLLARADISFDFDFRDAADMPKNAPQLKWVQATSAGIGEFLRRTELDKSGIVFTTAAGVHARPLTEFAMLGLLYFFRDVPYLQAIKSRKHWERYTVRGLEGARVLVVGPGSVGREIARACDSFGMEVWALRRAPGSASPEGVTRVIERQALRMALSEVDAVVLSCPLTEETRQMIGAPEIEAMRPGMVLVNVARGAVVNEPAMVEALRSGHIKGAALDVFAIEPLPAESPLWELPNVIVSPHSASTVAAENRRIVDIFLDNLGRFLDGRHMRNRFELERGY